MNLTPDDQRASEVSTSRMSDSSVADSSCSPEAQDESRGSSVSTELREEYENLLRYAVVTPVSSADANKMAGGGGGGATSSAAMVSGAAMASTVPPHQLQEQMSGASRSTRGSQPPPSPLNPEGT